jgi:hypothetical protein
MKKDRSDSPVLSRRISFFVLACTFPLWFSSAAAQTVSDPQDTLKRINLNYNTLKDACQEPDTGAARGLYYCSGVTLRMVNDGPFNPWDYRPLRDQDWRDFLLLDPQGSEHANSYSPGRFHSAHAHRRGGYEAAGQGAGIHLHLRFRWRHRA